MIRKILVISLSNIGDIILTFPAMDVLKRDFPDARLDLVLGPKGESLVKDNPALGKVYLYSKERSSVVMLKWMKELAAEKYDLVVDLRNSAIPFLIFPKRRTPLMLVRPKVGHMREQHLSRLRKVHHFTENFSQRILLRPVPVATPSGPYVVMAPGSRAENKRWPENSFAKLGDYLSRQYGVTVVLVGDETDVAIAAKISGLMTHKPLNMTGKLELPQVGYVMSRSKLVLVNDSAPSHLASYLNVPVAAFFGPTDPKKYGPWSDRNIVVRKNADCRACQDKNKYIPHTCIAAISFEDAFAALESWLKETLGGK